MAYEIILPIDELIFFKMVIAPPTSHNCWVYGRYSSTSHGADGSQPSQGGTTLQWAFPSGYVKIAIENGHRNSGFTY